MKGYVFVLGVDGFGNDISPVFDLPVYTSRKKAYCQLVELNRDEIKKLKGDGFYSKRIQDTQINKKLIFKDEDEIDLPIGLYGLVEIDIL